MKRIEWALKDGRSCFLKSSLGSLTKAMGILKVLPIPKWAAKWRKVYNRNLKTTTTACLLQSYCVSIVNILWHTGDARSGSQERFHVSFFNDSQLLFVQILAQLGDWISMMCARDGEDFSILHLNRISFFSSFAFVNQFLLIYKVLEI